MKATERVSMEANVPHHSIITRFRLFLRCFYPRLYGPFYLHPAKLGIPWFWLSMEVHHVYVLLVWFVDLVGTGDQYLIQVRESVSHHLTDDLLVTGQFRVLVSGIPFIGFRDGVGKEGHHARVVILWPPSIHPRVDCS